MMSGGINAPFSLDPRRHFTYAGNSVGFENSEFSEESKRILAACVLGNLTKRTSFPSMSVS